MIWSCLGSALDEIWRTKLRSLIAVLGLVIGIAGVIVDHRLGLVAVISLLVGGFEIMNFMRVAVSERTREIATRLVIGARPRDLLLQFLVEAIVLSLIGGLLGVALGIGGTLLLVHRLDPRAVFSGWTTLIAVAVAATIGVVFGFVPACRAARLDPIDALRHE